MTALLLIENLPVFADIQISGEQDDMTVKTYIYDSFTFPISLNGDVRYSGWDLNRIGGESVEGVPMRLKDTSPILPVEAKRELEPITFGEVELDFHISAISLMNDSYFGLRTGTDCAINFGFDKEYLWTEGSGERQNLLRYKTGVTYAVKTLIHMEKKTFDVSVDGKLCAEGVPFDEEFFDNFFVSTGNETVGQLNLEYIYITRGYWVNELFNMSHSCLPHDWSLKTVDALGRPIASDEGVQGKGYFEVVSRNGNTVLSKSFDAQSDDFTFDFQMNIPKFRDGIEIALKGGDEEVLKISADKTSFYYTDKAGNPVSFYDYKDNIWYTFKAKVNFSRKTFDLKLNGKVIKENIPLNASAASVDTLEVSSKKSENSFFFDNAKLYPQEHFEDYVPEPKVAESKGVDIGMQHCPLWWNGYHAGWDWVNDSDYRVPVNGFYDESSPELWDWDLKYMSEHGVDFIWYCWYKMANEGDPIHPADDQPALQEGYFEAKYSDKVKFALMFENGYVKDPFGIDQALNTERFLEDVARYWLEYFFKDPRYYTVEGRPLISFYDPWNFSAYFGGHGKQFIESLGDMCEAEGIGRPLVVFSHRGMAYSDMAAMNPDSAVYWYSMGSWPNDAIDASLTNYKNVTGAGLGYIPTISNGFDRYAWNQHETGVFYDNDDMKRALERYRDEILTLPNKFKTPIVMLSTWNEYGEGHIFAPTTWNGFGYLDAVREVFTDAGEHDDITPTEHQLDRFNNNYPHNRNTLDREVDVGRVPDENAYEKYKWDFDDSNKPGWKVTVANDSSITDGVLKMTAGGGQVQLSLTDSGIDTAEVTHIKLRVKNSGSCDNTKVQIATNFEKVHAGHAINNGITPNMEDFTDYYISVGKYPAFWRGILESLTIDFNATKKGDTVEIDSIAFMALPQEGDVTLSINKYTEKVNAVFRDGLPMLHLRKAVDAHGTFSEADPKIHWEAETNKVYVRKGASVLEFVPGEAEVICNGKAYNLPNSSELIDGVTYVNAEIISLAFSENVVWDEEQKIMTLTDNTKEVELVRPVSERKLLWSHEMDSMTGITYYLNMNSAGMSDGVWNYVTTTGDPQFYTSITPNLKCEEAKYIAIGLKVDKSSMMDFYFETVENPGWSEGKVFNLGGSVSSDIVEYVIDTSLSNSWTGNLKTIRFDASSMRDTNCSVDYIRIYGDYEYELTQEDIIQRYDTRVTAGDEIIWNFDLNNNRDGWVGSKSLANLTTAAGRLNADIIDKKPFFETAAQSLELSADEYKTLEICLKNTSGGKTAKVYFITEDSKDWSEDKSFEISLLQNDIAGVVYKINAFENEAWKGGLKGLRIVPTDVTEGSVCIDFVKLKK
ncbi:MAG: glycoside hydrolase family 99-like domain-containing protein [Clostridia bacterium]|nr:glycoside hydrolase family 99-like domain-containing protein [Clostridia bacterium]